MNTKKENKIPEFKSLGEEAVFGDTHDTTEFEEEFDEIEVEFESPLLRRGITIILDEPYLSQLKKLAERDHSEAAFIAREWVIERLEAVRL
jgi:hypothetical protein